MKAKDMNNSFKQFCYKKEYSPTHRQLFHITSSSALITYCKEPPNWSLCFHITIQPNIGLKCMLAHVIPLLKTLQWLPILFSVIAEILTTTYKIFHNLKFSTIQPSSPHSSPLSSSTILPLIHSILATMASLLSSNTNFRGSSMFLIQETSYSLYQVCPSPR